MEQALELEIPLPPLAEQKRIVALLDEAFAGIDEAKAKAEETRTAYSKMFDAQVELTFSDNQDWNKATLNDLGQTLTGTTPPTANPEYYGEYIPFIKPADFNEDGTLVTDNHGLSKEGEKVARVTNPDSVLMVCIGATIGKTGYTTKRITTNQQINSFTPGPLVNFRFAYYQMISSSFQKAVLSRANQATMPMISKSKWSEIPLQFPGNYSTQIKLAERLHDLKALTGQLAGMANRKVETLNEIKSSLLAQAFAGELTA
jgi:type I restriction enzyme S subunit